MTTLALAADVAGKWEGTVPGPQGEFSLVFDFTVDGETLGETVEGPAGQLAIQNGKIAGDDFTFDVTLGDGSLITHKAKHSGESIAVAATGPWGTTEYTLKPVAAN
jgi:hypothetical protein